MPQPLFNTPPKNSKRIVSLGSGLSLREFIALKHRIHFPALDMASILGDHEKHSFEITRKLDARKLKILPVFEQYLRYGYFPYFLEHPDEETYLGTLEQGLHTTIESDLPSIHTGLAGASIQKLKRLLAAIARSAPFTPDMKRLIEEPFKKTLLECLKTGQAS